MEDSKQPEQQPAQNVQSTDQTNPAPVRKGSNTLYIVIAVIILLVLAGIGFYLYKHSNVSQPIVHTQQTSQTSPMPTVQPSVTPVTAQNVDQVLQNTDNTIQQAVNQANTDLNAVNKINSSKDSTNNL